jgi:hypothetical protein
MDEQHKMDRVSKLLVECIVRTLEDHRTSDAQYETEKSRRFLRENDGPLCSSIAHVKDAPLVQGGDHGNVQSEHSWA